MTEKKIKVDNLNIYKANNKVDVLRYDELKNKKENDLLLADSSMILNKFFPCRFATCILHLITDITKETTEKFTDEEYKTIGVCFGYLLTKQDIPEPAKELFNRYASTFFSNLTDMGYTLFKFYYVESEANKQFADMHNIDISDKNVEILKLDGMTNIESLSQMFKGIGCEFNVSDMFNYGASLTTGDSKENVEKILESFKNTVVEISPFSFYR